MDRIWELFSPKSMSGYDFLAPVKPDRVEKIKSHQKSYHAEPVKRKRTPELKRTLTPRATPSSSKSRAGTPKLTRKPPKHEIDSDEEDEEDEVQSTDTGGITRAEKVDLGIDAALEPYIPVTVDHPDHIGWSQEEVDLFNRLNERGTVPLMYSEWQLDFPTVPDQLFSSNKEEIFIKALEGSEFRGK